MGFQVVVLAGGTSKNLAPLVSKEVPKALLPVANRPVLSYVLELLEQNNFKDLIVVVEGDYAASRIGGWISGAYVDRLHVEVAVVPEDIGSAGAIRAISPYLTSHDVLIVSGDLVCDISPGLVAATHRQHDAAVTAMLCSAFVSGPSESRSSGGKDKARKPRHCNVIGFDSTKQFLLFIDSGVKVENDFHFHKRLLRAAGQMELRRDLMDANLYAFKRAALLQVLEREENFESLKHDVLPYMVGSQLRSEIVLSGMSHWEEIGKKHEMVVSKVLRNSCTPAFHERYASLSTAPPKVHKCCVYIASNDKYCARLNSIQAFCDINRDVMAEAHVWGFCFSSHNNIIHPSVKLGSKSTVGAHCMVGEGCEMGEKCSVKWSVIGRHCRIGSNVKVVNSVVMNHVTLEHACSIQSSIICSNAQLREHVVLKDCQVGEGYVISSGSDLKGESFAKRER